MNESVAKYHVDGIDCATSAKEVEAAVARLPGVTGVEVSILSAAMLVRHKGQLPAAAIDHTVKWLGHAISPSPEILSSGTTPSGQSADVDVVYSREPTGSWWSKSARHAARWFV